MSSFKLYNQVRPDIPEAGSTVFWPDENGELKYMGSDGVVKDFSVSFGGGYSSVTLQNPVSISQDWFEPIIEYTLTGKPEGKYRISLSGACKLSDVISDLRFAIYVNGNIVGEEIRVEPKDKSDSQRIPINSFKLFDLANGDKVEVRACTEDWSQTLDIFELAMDMWRVG